MTDKRRASPRASLIVLGYNSERFVDQAITSAFAQTYPNLEIILSDDCSADGTFARMKAALGTYSGEHSVKLNRTAVNSGTLAHVYQAVRSATGDLIVLAAGDDVSYPERVERLVAEWQERGAHALFSSQDLIDERGKIIARGHRYDDSLLEWNDYFPSFLAIRGATSAYTRATFTDIPLPSARILFEDTFLSLMLHLQGRVIAYVDEPLVQYRVHQAAVTNAVFAGIGSSELLTRERKAENYAASMAAVLKAFEANLGMHAAPRHLASDRQFYEFSSKWMNSTAMARLKVLLAAKRPQHRRWILARLFGPQFLIFLKFLRGLRGVAEQPLP